MGSFKPPDDGRHLLSLGGAVIIRTWMVAVPLTGNRGNVSHVPFVWRDAGKEFRPLSPRPRTPFILVETDSDLESLFARVKRAKRIALDTEADSLHHYYEKVCLIQLSVGKEHFVVDPLSGIRLERFLNLLSGKPLILHGADYDLRILRATFGFQPRGAIFDTMIAAQLLGYEKVGLAALILHFFGVTLSKAGQREDWSRRPLTIAQLEYASDDTRYLGGLAGILEGELREKDRSRWLEESCEAMKEATAKDKPPPDPDAVWRIKGVGDLERRQLAFVRELWHWREKEAQSGDLPPFKIMRNQDMVKWALWAASRSRINLEKGPKLPSHYRARRINKLRNALERARSLPKSKWPMRLAPKKSTRLAGPEIEALRSENLRKAAALGIDPGNLASRSSLENIVRRRPRTLEEIMEAGSLLQWQAEQLEEGVRRALISEETS